MKRRRLLAAACAHCTALASVAAWAQASAPAPWAAPSRFLRPELSSDEGGLWSLMDREESRLRRSPF
ncbi:MAG TPA: hypothetical protein VIK58_16305, partial [Caldimonas sp.]